jgi:hypothetical protein
MSQAFCLQRSARTAFVGLTILAIADAAFAARPDTRVLTCSQGRAMLAQSGAIVFTTGQNTYDRIVHNRGFCNPGQEAVQISAPTVDEPYCKIGYTCRDRTVSQ